MLNNHTKEQFMNRSASFSTHGSRRGYSDLGLPLSYSDLLSAEERKKIILDRIVELNLIDNPPKKIKAHKTQLSFMVSQINLEIKKERISSVEEIEQRMNFGKYFVDYCRRNMPKDYYLELVNAARKEFESI